jgi:long-chain fatty acid transport protein
MRPSSLHRAAISCCLLSLPLSVARATDGHFLHGIGAINSAMGGAGVAAPQDVLSAFYLNPAGLMAFAGSRADLSFEMFRPDRSVASAAGPYNGSTRSTSSFTPVPALGFSTRLANDRVTIGLGAFGIGGFGVNYPVDPTNPILAPRPYGFGQVFSSFQLLKIAPGAAFAVSDRLWIGGALNVDWASLMVDPFAAAAPAADPGPDGIPRTQDDRAYYSSATASDGAFGIGGQIGVIYKPAPTVSLGASYTSTQHFNDFEFNSSFADPNRPDFGTPRPLRFRLDVPAVYAAGASIVPVASLVLSADVRYITYESTEGFKGGAFAPDGSVQGFGWKNIAVGSIGAQLAATERLSLRAGYNYGGNPVPPGLTMINLPAPAITQHHLTLGAGFQATPTVGMHGGYYHAFQNSITGALLNPSGPIPGTSVTSTLSENSFLVQFTVRSMPRP